VRGKGIGLTDAAAPFLSTTIDSASFSVIDFFSSSQSSSVIDFFSSASCLSLNSFSSTPTSCSSIIDSSTFLNVVNFIWLSSSNTLSSTCQK